MSLSPSAASWLNEGNAVTSGIASQLWNRIKMRLHNIWYPHDGSIHPELGKLGYSEPPLPWRHHSTSCTGKMCSFNAVRVRTISIPTSSKLKETITSASVDGGFGSTSSCCKEKLQDTYYYSCYFLNTGISNNIKQTFSWSLKQRTSSYIQGKEVQRLSGTVLAINV